MKTKSRPVIGAVLAALLFVVWLTKRHERTPANVGQANKTNRSQDTILSSSRQDTGTAAVPYPATLLTETAEKLAEFDRLRASPDNIETFRRSADIENEFNNSLDPAKAAYLIRHMPPGFVDSYFGALCLHKWASTSRTEAAQWMQEHPSDWPTTARALAEGWLGDDRTSLYAYLDRLPSGAWRSNLAYTASEDAFLAKEPAEVIALLGRVSGPNSRRDQLYEWNTTAWAAKDHPAALRWIEGSSPPELRQPLLAAAAIGYANTRPAAAAEWAQANVSDPAALKSALHAIARIWSTKDQAAALRWVESLPAGPPRDSAADGLIAIAKPELDTD